MSNITVYTFNVEDNTMAKSSDYRKYPKRIIEPVFNRVGVYKNRKTKVTWVEFILDGNREEYRDFYEDCECGILPESNTLVAMKIPFQEYEFIEEYNTNKLKKLNNEQYDLLYKVLSKLDKRYSKLKTEIKKTLESRYQLSMLFGVEKSLMLIKNREKNRLELHTNYEVIKCKH